jgi:anti-sigma regulatory factor (Ser/Thr protein kinase)
VRFCANAARPKPAPCRRRPKQVCRAAVVDIYMREFVWRPVVAVSEEANLERGPTEDDGQWCMTAAVTSARDARVAVLALPLDEERKERAVLIVSELAANAILHAGGVLSLRVQHDQRRVRLEVADASPVLPGPVKVSTMSGRGLQLIEALAEAWGAERRSGGKIVWAELEQAR